MILIVVLYFIEVMMSNLNSHNQPDSWDKLEKTIDKFIEQSELINDYYQSLIDTNDNEQECKKSSSS